MHSQVPPSLQLLRNSDGREKDGGRLTEQTDSGSSLHVHVEGGRGQAVGDDAPTPTPTTGDPAIEPVIGVNSISFPEKDRLLAEKEIQVFHFISLVFTTK